MLRWHLYRRFYHLLIDYLFQSPEQFFKLRMWTSILSLEFYMIHPMCIISASPQIIFKSFCTDFWYFCVLKNIYLICMKSRSSLLICHQCGVFLTQNISNAKDNMRLLPAINAVALLRVHCIVHTEQTGNFPHSVWLWGWKNFINIVKHEKLKVQTTKLKSNNQSIT